MDQGLILLCGILGFGLCALLCQSILQKKRQVSTDQVFQNRPLLPLFGGVACTVAVSASCVAGIAIYQSVGSAPVGKNQLATLLCALLFCLGLGFVGFTDDYFKLIKNQPVGIGFRRKQLLLLVFSALFVGVLAAQNGANTTILMPILGSVNVGGGYYLICIGFVYFVLLGCDILKHCAGVPSFLCFAVCVGMLPLCGKLAASGLAIFCSVCAGGMCALFGYRYPPAKISLGSCGSLFIGASVCVACLCVLPMGGALIAAPLLVEGTLGALAISGVFAGLSRPLHKQISKKFSLSPSGLVLFYGLVSLLGMALTMIWTINL